MASEWRQSTWGDEVTLRYGKALRGYDSARGRFRVFGSNGPIGWTDSELASGPSVILGRKGAYRGVHFSSDPFWVIDTAYFVVPNSDLDPRWVYYAMKHYKLGEIDDGSPIPSTTRAAVAPIEVAVPPINEQRAIARALSILDDRIDLLRQTNATLEAIAAALFKSWFVDFDPVRAKAEGREPEGMDSATAALFPSEFEESDLGSMPKGWRVVPLLDACDLDGGAQPPAHTFVDAPRDGYVRLLQIRDFATDSHKTFIPVKKNTKVVSEDDILLGRYGSASGNKAKDSLGRLCRGLSGTYNVALMKLSPLLVGREFAFQLFNDPRFYAYLQGISSKAVQSGFSKQELALYRVVIPPAELLARYEEFGERIWSRVKSARKQAEILSGLRDHLLPRLISGKLRLPEAEAMVEEAIA